LGKKFYESFNEAHREAKETKTIGFLQINSNFTSFFADVRAKKAITGNQTTEVYLDNTLILQVLTQMEIFFAYRRFIEQIMVDCEDLLTIENSPIMTEALYGKFVSRVTETIGLGFVPL
jgi:hypothetical protein